MTERDALAVEAIDALKDLARAAWPVIHRLQHGNAVPADKVEALRVAYTVAEAVDQRAAQVFVDMVPA